MATTKSTETTKQLTYLSGALKAPRILDVAGRLADQARDAGWTFEDYLVTRPAPRSASAGLGSPAARPSTTSIGITSQLSASKSPHSRLGRS